MKNILIKADEREIMRLYPNTIKAAYLELRLSLLKLIRSLNSIKIK